MDRYILASQSPRRRELLHLVLNEYEVIPALVLTKASDLYSWECLPDSNREIQVCSGDMLFNVFDEYMGFLDD